MRKKISLLIVCIMLATTFSGIFYVKMSVADPTTIYVDDNNTAGPWNGTVEHPFQHIQDGVNAANPGDTVFVYSGIYYEQVTLDGSTNKNNVTLLGENKNRTIIDACGNSFALYIVNSNSEHISKFSLTNASSFSCSFAADGIFCYDNEISDCTIVNNLGTGLRIYSHYQNASNNRIINCDIYGNNGYGIKIETNNGSVSDNVIYHNNIFNNGQNAYDTGSNIWYNAAIREGNWWLDYTGEDNNHDGIGDTPYNIPGGSNQDLYPFMNENGWLLPQNQPPVANFTFAPNNPTNITVIHFTDTSTDPDGTIVSGWWNFGDHYFSDLQNPIHCYYTNGEYTITLTVTDNVGVTNTMTWTILVNTPVEILDQQQTQYNDNFVLYTTRWGSQSFKPTVTSLTRVEVLMRKAGTPPSGAVLSVRSSLTGNDLISISKPASQIPKSNGWVEFDFNDLTVTPGSTYYLVLKTNGGSSKNCYNWGYGTNTPYTNGMQWTSANSGSKWTHCTKYDFCFKTYGFS